MATFGERLHQLRLSKNITQKQMASVFKITERAYQRYEGNQSTPHYNTLIALADYFDVSLDFITGRCDNPNSHKL
jgi:transcriptional regulator, XRE family|nr:MAG TPA: helix-turn-helix domain protein [Caudoviricetes sp.]